MSNTHNKISTWAQEHNVEAQEVINFLAQNGKPGMKSSQNIPQDVLKKVEEHFKQPEVPSDTPSEPASVDSAHADVGGSSITINPESIPQSIGVTIKNPVNPVEAILLKQKVVASGTMSQEEVKKFINPAVNIKPEPQNNIKDVVKNIIKEKIREALVARQHQIVTTPVSRIEPIPYAPKAETEEYFFDPHPAWGYIGAAAGGVTLAVLFAKLFGGK